MGRREGKRPTTGKPHGKDHRMTVVDCFIRWKDSDTVCEAIEMHAGKIKRRILFRLVGKPAVDFGWLIGYADPDHVCLQWHPDETGEIAKLRCRAVEMVPLT